jgi:hypothetical protein
LPCLGSLILLVGSAKGQAYVDLVNLTFSPSNAGDVAAHPNVSNITPWTNGSEVLPDPFDSGLYTMPDDDFGNGYAGLTTITPRFGWKWGFEGSFDVSTSQPWQVGTISFDYDVLGHNGEALLDLTVGSWTGQAYLPTTGSDWDLPTDNFYHPELTGLAGVRATGTVTFDLLAGTLTVTGTGSLVSNPSFSRVYDPYTVAIPGGFNLNTGTHAIDILVSNTKVESEGGFDANAGSTNGQDAFYRIDNFRITGTQIPEPSALFLSLIGAVVCLNARRRKH